MRRRFFVEGFHGRGAALGGESARHLARVLRARPGQLYELSDGRAVWLGRVERVARDAVEFSLLEQLPAAEPRLRTILLLAVVKFERFEWCLEKAAELGVAAVVPLVAARSERALVAAAPRRAERWRRILVEASQQSRRLRPPELRDPVRPAPAFRLPAEGALRLLLSERADAPPLREALAGCTADAAMLAIGPEGGWTEEEIAAARAGGFEEASLGPLVLRTETAVLAALAVLNYALGEAR